MLKYRTAHITDLPAMMKMVNEAKEGFRSRNIDQWQKGEPNEQGLTEAIKKDLVHVLEESNEVLPWSLWWPALKPIMRLSMVPG